MIPTIDELLRQAVAAQAERGRLVHTIHIPMIARDAALMPPPVGHRGWWAMGDAARVGDLLKLVVLGELEVLTTVTAVYAPGIDFAGAPAGEFRQRWVVEWREAAAETGPAA
jgi:hypothetical protein